MNKYKAAYRLYIVQMRISFNSASIQKRKKDTEYYRNENIKLTYEENNLKKFLLKTLSPRVDL